MNRSSCCALLAALGVVLGGCDSHKKEHLTVAEQDRRIAPVVHPALQGTIGNVAALADTAPVHVEGYGIVADLPNTGSGEMPPPVRQILVEELYKQHAGSFQYDTKDINPERILNSKYIAAVSVSGFIPPLSPKGTTFDLTVRALPGTQTTSLEHGLLWTSELKLIGLTENGGMDTRILAKGRGPVFCNPFIKKTDSQGTLIARNVRTGRVMAGGMLLEDLSATLQLYTPSYRITSQIQRTVNSRFPNMPPYASALSDSVVALTIPAAYHDNPREFTNIILHMYMAQDIPGFTDRKVAEILAALADPAAPHDSLGMALEGLGRTILPALQNAYVSNDATVRFYAARAGAGLGDSSAVVVLESFARNDKSPHQYDAIAAIARNGDSLRTNTVLTNLLDSENLRVRIGAYDALLRVGSPTLNSFGVGRKFIVDRLVTDGPPIVYATQTGTPRIALIGKKFTLPAGTLYISADELLTLSYPETPEAPPDSSVPGAAANLGAPATPPGAADQTDREPVKLYYRGLLGNRAVLLKSNPSLGVVIAKLGFAPDPRATDYDPKQPFIGVSYQRVLELLDKLCKDHTLDATFVMQQPTREELSLAAEAGGPRPESNGLLPESLPVTTPASQPAPTTQPLAPASAK